MNVGVKAGQRQSRLGKVAAYRDVVYLVLLSLLGMAVMNASIECPAEVRARFLAGNAFPNSKVQAEQYRDTVSKNAALHAELAEMGRRIMALEEDLEKANSLCENRAVEAHIERIKAASAKASHPDPSAEPAIVATRQATAVPGEHSLGSHGEAGSSQLGVRSGLVDAPTTSGVSSDNEQRASSEATNANSDEDESASGSEEEEQGTESKGGDRLSQVQGDGATNSLGDGGDGVQQPAEVEAHEEEQNEEAEDEEEAAAAVADQDQDEADDSEEGIIGEDEEDEDDEDDEEANEVPMSPKQYGYEDLGEGKFRILNQVSSSTKKHFKSVATKFITLFRAWEHAGWKHRYDTAPGGASLYLTKPISKVPSSAGKMISQITKSSCIGGTKGAQLRCKVKLAAKFGCNFAELGISPMQFNLEEKADCIEFMRIASAPENEEKQWILKDGGSYHGKRMKFYKGLKSEVKRKFGKCTKDKKAAGSIMMEYIHNPVLFSERKFDLRTYLLIGSTKPFMVFYHDGFVRRSGAAYKNSTFSKLGHITNHKTQDKQAGHFWGFNQLGEYLHDEEGFPEDYMESAFRSYVKHATNFVFQAARARLKRRAGSFMLFGLDWMIDKNRNIHFLEANGNPTIQNYEPTGLGPAIWNEMADLLTRLHREPSTLPGEPTVSSAFSYGGWQLVFNEAEELVKGQTYNACKFRDYLQCTDPDRCPIW